MLGTWKNPPKIFLTRIYYNTATNIIYQNGGQEVQQQIQYIGSRILLKQIIMF